MCEEWRRKLLVVSTGVEWLSKFCPWKEEVGKALRYALKMIKSIKRKVVSYSFTIGYERVLGQYM